MDSVSGGMADLVIRDGALVTPGGIVGADIGITGGRISAIGGTIRAGETFRAGGLTVLPGIIDSQVHFREPGGEHKEDLATGSVAAVLGGVTTVLEMPNTWPPTVSAQAIRDKFARARGRMYCNHGFFVGASGDNVAQLAALERLPGVPGVKIFMGASTGDLLVPDDPALERVLRAGRRRVAVHAEDHARLLERKALFPEGDPACHPLWRDPETAGRATARILALARRTGRPVHVLHVSSAGEIPLLAAHRDIATFEITPQHLTLSVSDCERLGTLAQMNPPIRDQGHQEALWRAIGLVDTIGSDHAPHLREEKALPWPRSPSGMPGVQTLLPLMLTHVARGRLSLGRLAALLAAGPARVWEMTDRGEIRVGNHADLTLVDLARRQVITESWLASRCGWSPFTGMEVTGMPVATLVGGRWAMRDGEPCEVAGRPVCFAGGDRTEAAE